MEYHLPISPVVILSHINIHLLDLSSPFWSSYCSCNMKYDPSGCHSSYLLTFWHSTEELKKNTCRKMDSVQVISNYFSFSPQQHYYFIFYNPRIFCPKNLTLWLSGGCGPCVGGKRSRSSNLFNIFATWVAAIWHFWKSQYTIRKNAFQLWGGCGGGVGGGRSVVGGPRKEPLRPLMIPGTLVRMIMTNLVLAVIVNLLHVCFCLMKYLIFLHTWYLSILVHHHTRPVKSTPQRT